MNYDMATVIMVCLGETERREKDILRLLGVLLSPEIRPGTKKKILEQEYGIPMTVEMEKEAENMCDYGRGLARKYAEKGRTEGMEKAYNRNATAISWVCCGKRSPWRPLPASRKYRWSRSGNWEN